MNLFLDALHCRNLDRPPVWFMRQAGRYLPEYRALRSKHSLWELFHNPELATIVTLQPIDQFGFDAAILFSDILVIAETFDLTVRFPEGQGPSVVPALQSAQDVQALPAHDVEKLHYVKETIQHLKSVLKVPLIGFCGAPFTVASYLIAKELGAKKWLKEDPKSFHLLLDKLTQASISYLQMQIAAGVDAVQIFDSWANLLDDAEFASFSLYYLQKIVHALRPTGIPVILFCRDSSLRAKALSALQPTAISFDWQRELCEIRKEVPAHIAVQGNLNPELLKQSPQTIETAVKKLLLSMEGDPGFIVNLGHGITPDIPVEHVRCFVQAVHHFATGGIEQRIASGFPPDKNPNFVPRS